MLYLRNARWIDWRTLRIRDCHLAVDDGPGSSAVRAVDEVPQGAVALDCRGRIVTRAFAIGHHHVYSALARGMPPPVVPPGNFVEILERIWWKLDKALDADMIRASALATAAEAARCGATFVIDHHASPDAARGSLGAIAEAFDEVGVSHLLCYELSDRDGPERLADGLAETEAYLESHQGLVGLHASFTVGDGLLARAVDLARAHETGVHVHVAEDAVDQQRCRREHGQTVVERLAAAGALESPRTLLVHCLHLEGGDRERIRDSAAWVVQNSESNQNNAVGRFDPRGLGDRVLLGTDGMHSDMLAAARAAYLEGQSVGSLPPLDAYRRLRRVHDYLRQNGFSGDGENDLVVLDYPSPTPVTQDNWPAHVVYGLSSRHVHTVIRQGCVLVDAGRVVTIDHEKVLADARRQAARLWERL